jgi:hypothetical protein
MPLAGKDTAESKKRMHVARCTVRNNYNLQCPSSAPPKHLLQPGCRYMRSYLVPRSTSTLRSPSCLRTKARPEARQERSLNKSVL